MHIHRHLTTIFCCLMGMLWHEKILSQSPLSYESISTSKGLSQGYIWDILQDKNGFLWFTTKAGLNRYDGYNFKVYAYNAYDSTTISSNATLHLYEDSKDRIWIGTEDNGINVFDKKKERFHRILHKPKDPNSLSGNRINHQITELADGRFLINSTETRFDIITLPTDFFEKSTPPIFEQIPKPMDCYNQILYTDSKKITWFNCNGKQFRFHPDKNSFVLETDFKLHFNTIFNSPDGLWINDERISEIDNLIAYPSFSKNILNGQGSFFLKETNNRLWIAISNLNLLRVYDLSKWQRNKPLNPDDCLIASDTLVGSMKLYKDKTGLIWLGLNGHGIRKYSFESEKFNHKARGFSVKKIIRTNQGEIFVQSWAADKIVQPDGSLVNNNWVEKKHTIFDYFINRKGDLWLTKRKARTSPKLLELEQINLTTKKSSIYPVDLKGNYGDDQRMLEDNEGHFWIGGLGGSFTVFNPATGKAKEYTLSNDSTIQLDKNTQITTIYQDGSGIIWMGTEKGFAKIENQAAISPKITWFQTNLKNRNSLNNGHISSFLDDPSDPGTLWISTKGGGLNRMEKATGKFSHITTAEGLCNDVVYGILSDEMGNIWGSTNNGLFCITATKNSTFDIRHFTEVAGLQAAEFNTGAFAKFPNGQLAFGGINGMNVFNPKEILIDTFAPNIFITRLLINNKEIKPNDGSGLLKEAIEFTPAITLHHEQDQLTIEFSSLDFRAPDQNKYRYQLAGIDKEWVESGNRRRANYIHLPSGNYTFRVQGSNSRGIWSNKVAELIITSLPPWWLSWWAYLIYAFLIGYGAISYFRFKVNKARLQTQLKFEQKEAKRIKELNSVKTQLYANITHEFRTPLTVILGMANQIKSDPEKHLHDGLNMIVRNGNNLLKLVNELLDLSKLEDGKMSLHQINGDLVAFLRYIVEAFQSLAASQQKQFHFLADTDEMRVAYDPEKLSQIITNLLSNALKFTPALGNVYVSITQLANPDPDTTILVLKVKDTGIGIPENQLEHIFDRFYQVDNSHTRTTEGTGIGLSLTQELVKLMDGTITVKSPPVGATRGTEFTISIPFKKAQSELLETVPSLPLKDAGLPATANKQKDTTKESNKPLLLLVEDNIDVVAYTATCLPDYKLSVGKDGQEGYAIAVDIIPDLIITDVMMPYIDGFEMCRKLREDERTSHIPIIMLTAKADIQSKLEGLEKGADVYLEKPFNKDELLLRIRKLLEQRKNLQQYYSKQIGLAAAEMPVEAVASTNIKEHEFVKKIRELVEANFSNYEFNVEQLCRQVFMSHSQLHRKLEALTNCTPNKFIRLVRLQKAKELLADPRQSIGSIALDCGYIDAGYFARVFKQEYGVTPQEWRAGII
ncbi:hybrid sensor histidine kinase/response regulator transcription factor [Flavihumibacter sp. UBA7668]|uniref:hybrid sensor histidine kinase/response regulator transcription factor n=1 Tax=Flavihumibacter sp. UBA7668 TaxID=1946542 RepID=UPI0025B8738F|nr:hybrid sensor histidine kinase/response regulator transcription factor [Flavihumibacter sp. UBA7668]